MIGIAFIVVVTSAVANTTTVGFMDEVDYVCKVHVVSRPKDDKKSLLNLKFNMTVHADLSVTDGKYPGQIVYHFSADGFTNTIMIDRKTGHLVAHNVQNKNTSQNWEGSCWQIPLHRT
jgi:hypothetical protein